MRMMRCCCPPRWNEKRAVPRPRAGRVPGRRINLWIQNSNTIHHHAAGLSSSSRPQDCRLSAGSSTICESPPTGLPRSWLFPPPYRRRRRLDDAVATGREAQFDIVATVSGGGLSGQAGALRHGISKALTHFEGGNLYNLSPGVQSDLRDAVADVDLELLGHEIRTSADDR